jgi:hypothetical protein
VRIELRDAAGALVLWTVAESQSDVTLARALADGWSVVSVNPIQPGNEDMS